MAVFRGGIRTNDVFSGGTDADAFFFGIADLNGLDKVAGGDGRATDRLLLTTAGTLSAGRLFGVSGVEAIYLADGTNSITIANALAASAFNRSVRILGGSGSDTVDASSLTALNRVVVEAGAGADTLKGGSGNDEFRFRIENLGRDDFIAGGSGTDTLRLLNSGTLLAAHFSGVSELERLFLSNDGNAVAITNSMIGTGLLGSLVIAGGRAADAIDGSRIGTARILVVDAGAGDDVATGGAGSDLIAGGAGSDDLAGGAGADAILFDPADVRIDGGGGADTLLLRGAAAIYLASADQSYGDNASVSGFEHVDASASSAGVTVVGRDGYYNVLIGGSGADRLYGGSNDFGAKIVGGRGADTMWGSGGRDDFYLMGGDFAAGERISGSSGDWGDWLHIWGSNDLTKGHVYVSDIVLGAHDSNGRPLDQGMSIRLTDAQFMVLSGVRIEEGQPGGTVERVVIELTGHVSYGGSATTDLRYPVFYDFDQEDAVIVLGRGESDNVVGLNGIAYTFRGNGGDDRIFLPILNAGTKVFGDSGNDVVQYEDVAGRGSGLIDGGTGNDTLFAQDTYKPIKIDLRMGDQTLGDLATVRNFENVDFRWATLGNLEVVGNSGANMIIATFADDRLSGGGGDDILDGGQGGLDHLTGGAGRDCFRWSEDNHRASVTPLDVVTDYVAADDSLLFQGFDFDGPAFDTRMIARSTAMDITGADLVCYTGEALDSAADVQAYLASAAGGSVGEGVFVVGRNSEGDTVLFHALDASFSGSNHVAAIANLGTSVEAERLFLSEFQFI